MALLSAVLLHAFVGIADAQDGEAAPGDAAPSAVDETTEESTFGDASSFLGDAAAIDDSVVINGVDKQINFKTGVVTARGDVDIAYGDIQIHAGRAEYHNSTGDIYLYDDVTIHNGELVYRGETVVYNVKTGDITASEMRSALPPFYYETNDIEFNTQDQGNTITLEDSVLTTHDYEDPDYHIKAKTIEIIPDDRVIFRDLKVYVGETPVFWLPYLSQPLNEDLGYSFTPGYSSRWGAFLLNDYGLALGEDYTMNLQFDLRSKRGFAGGFELESLRHSDNPNIGKLQVYGAHDNDPESNFSAQNRANLDANRYRLSLQHRVYLPGAEDETFYIDFDLNKFSDEFVLEDFFPAEFLVNPRPDSIINLVKTNPRFEISLWGRFRANEFYTTDSRLPELAIDFTRQPIFGTGFFYEGETSLGIYEEDLDNARQAMINNEIAGLSRGLPFSSDPMATRSMIDLLRAASTGNRFFRFDSYHQVLYPIKVRNGVTLVPRVGVRGTTYSDVSGGLRNDDETRFLFHAGLEGSAKFSKVYPNVQIPKLGVDEFRHIFQPYFNYSYLTGDDLPRGYPLIDRYAPTTNLRPIDLPLFTAIDELRDWNVARVGMRNRLQTKRKGGSSFIGGDYYNQRLAPRTGDTHNWIDLDTYLEFYGTDPEFDRDFSNLFNRLSWWPLPWLIASVDSQLPVFNEATDFKEVNTDLTFMPWRHTELIVGHRYLDDHPFLEDSSQLTLRTYTRINDNWGFSMNHRYELDDNTWEMQQYSIHRDLSRWTMAIGGMILDNRVDEEYGFVFTLSLKDFPRARAPLSIIPGSEGL